MKSPSIQVNKDEYNEDKKFSPKITSPALELTNIQDGNIGLHLQVPRGGTHPNGVRSELTLKKKIPQVSLFCYSWFRLQLIAIHCNRRGVWTEHPHTAYFSCTLHMCFTPHWGSRCRSACLIKRCSCTCHHMSERSLFPCFVFFLCLLCVYFFSHFYLISVLNSEHKTQCAPEE